MGTLKAQNLALLTKWWWKLKEKSGGLWRESISSIHNLKRKPTTIIAKTSILGVWSNIAKAIKSLTESDVNYHDLFTLTPGSNISIVFWKDRWCGSLTLQERFPRLYELEGMNTQPVLNKFRFNLIPDGNYTVNILRQRIDSSHTLLVGTVINWSKVVPLKIQCFVWRAVLDRLRVASNLSKRGVSVQSNLCSLCNNEQETGDHLLIRCNVA
uniref:Reverse transcriptase zinc-binding domain-containing protein n=1 Tax=Lactuca sativa TaxID=4236 RepID=A0A9R1UFZ1_LACSA|nr:hypothetical protein LSAT_V11C900467460 [Lactuca sativa]